MSKNSSGAAAQATKPMQASKATATTKPQATATKTPVPMEKVAKLAYEKWLKAGCQHGCDQQHWYEAEMELRGGK
jgi:hypothetical protein